MFDYSIAQLLPTRSDGQVKALVGNWATLGLRPVPFLANKGHLGQNDSLASPFGLR